MHSRTHYPNGKTRDLHFKEKVSAINLQVLNPHFEYLFFYDRQVELFIDSTFRNTETFSGWQSVNYAFGAFNRHPFLKPVIDNGVRAQREPRMGGAYDVWKPTPVGPTLSHSKHDWPGAFDQDAGRERWRNKYPVPEDICDYRLWFRSGDLGVYLMSGSRHGEKVHVIEKAAIYGRPDPRRDLFAGIPAHATLSHA